MRKAYTSPEGSTKDLQRQGDRATAAVQTKARIRPEHKTTVSLFVPSWLLVSLLSWGLLLACSRYVRRKV